MLRGLKNPQLLVVHVKCFAETWLVECGSHNETGADLWGHEQTCGFWLLLKRPSVRMRPLNSDLDLAVLLLSAIGRGGVWCAQQKLCSKHIRQTYPSHICSVLPSGSGSRGGFLWLASCFCVSALFLWCALL
jgi:hypothetical protein